MFYIIGVNHLVQSLSVGATPTPENLSYTSCLNDAIVRLKPTLIAEEESRESLGERISIAEALARNRVDHILCDPEERERKAIGYRCLGDLQSRIYQENQGISDHECEVRATAIEIAREFGKREDYWLTAMEDRDLSITIFVCGDVHVDGFRKRLSGRGISSDVLARGLGMTDAQRELIAEAKFILERDPGIEVV
jgi:hypothetical protein